MIQWELRGEGRKTNYCPKRKWEIFIKACGNKGKRRLVQDPVFICKPNTHKHTHKIPGTITLISLILKMKI